MRGRADPSGTKIEFAGFLLDLFGQLVDVFDFKMLWSHDQHIGHIGYLGHCNKIGQWVVSKLGQRGVDSDRADRVDDRRVTVWLGVHYIGGKIGRASCVERGCESVWLSLESGSVNKNN